MGGGNSWHNTMLTFPLWEASYCSAIIHAVWEERKQPVIMLPGRGPPLFLTISCYHGYDASRAVSCGLPHSTYLCCRVCHAATWEEFGTQVLAMLLLYSGISNAALRYARLLRLFHTSHVCSIASALLPHLVPYAQSAAPAARAAPAHARENQAQMPWKQRLRLMHCACALAWQTGIFSNEAISRFWYNAEDVENMFMYMNNMGGGARLWR